MGTRRRESPEEMTGESRGSSGHVCSALLLLSDRAYVTPLFTRSVFAKPGLYPAFSCFICILDEKCSSIVLSRLTSSAPAEEAVGEAASAHLVVLLPSHLRPSPMGKKIRSF